MIVWTVSDLSDPDVPARLYISLEKAVSFIFSAYRLTGGDHTLDEPVLYAVDADSERGQQRFMRVCNGGLVRFMGKNPSVTETCALIREQLHRTIDILNLDTSEDPRISGEQET